MLYVHATRNGSEEYSTKDGMEFEVVQQLMAALGYTGIELVTKEVYDQALAAKQQ